MTVIARNEWISYSHWGMFPVRQKTRALRQEPRLDAGRKAR